MSGRMSAGHCWLAALLARRANTEVVSAAVPCKCHGDERGARAEVPGRKLGARWLRQAGGVVCGQPKEKNQKKIRTNSKNSKLKSMHRDKETAVGACAPPTCPLVPQSSPVAAGRTIGLGANTRWLLREPRAVFAQSGWRCFVVVAVGKKEA
ncbi:hypothetical protein DFH07DRAFT_763878 [Mycena maculata]|uniref:Secreted protein n=1 Tax=Mycena maculata TaxID=230809 RepID=A0AAD7P2U2_9AGAR|nr:hypothetical protein DFH07DRAFT_763878 [Mycena maculata]